MSWRAQTEADCEWVAVSVQCTMHLASVTSETRQMHPIASQLILQVFVARRSSWKNLRPRTENPTCG